MGKLKGCSIKNNAFSDSEIDFTPSYAVVNTLASDMAASGTIGIYKAIRFPSDDIMIAPWSDRHSQVQYQTIPCPEGLGLNLIRATRQRITVQQMLPESSIVDVIDLSERELEWAEYIKQLRTDASLAPNVVDDILSVRDQLHNYFDTSIDPPNASPGDDDGIRLLWETEKHQLMVDVLPSRCIHWVYRNRETEAYDGGENVPNDRFPPLTLQSFLDGWRKELKQEAHARPTDYTITVMGSRDSCFG
jgi:hypothetical protein